MLPWFHARVELVRRVRSAGRPAAHVAAEMGVSRQCAHRWLARFDAEGLAGLYDRSSRPRSCPTRTPAEVEAVVLACRDQQRIGRDRVAEATGVPSRTVSRILARHGRLPLAVLDPVTGMVIRASRSTALRYERDAAGDLWCTSTSRSSARSPTAAAGGYPDAVERPHRYGAWATTTCTPRSIGAVGRLLPAGLLRDPGRREGPDLRSVPAAGGGLVRRPRHHRAAGDERQRDELRQLDRLRQRPDQHRQPTTSPSDRTVPGTTAKSNASTAPWPSNGPTASPTPATPPAPPP